MSRVIALKKSLLFLHRWLGVALCVVFLLWFPSGIGMMYWDYPAVTAADRLERSTRIDPARVLLTPAEAAERAGMQPPAQIRLNTFDGRPVYRFGGRGGPSAGLGASGTVVYADTGEPQVAVDTELLNRIASAWTGRPAREATIVPLEEVDQWTIQTFRTSSPLTKYSWPSGEQVYISEASGEVVQYTTRASRLGAYLGPIPHWLYFTPLRKHGQTWTRVVVWSSGIGTFAAILGVVIGVWMYSPSKKYRFAGASSSIPYTGQKRWHMVLGLVFGIATATWAFSGMLSMDPFPSRTGGAVGGGTAGGRGGGIPEALRGRVEMASFAAEDPRAALDKLSELDVRELEWTSFAGEPIYLATLAGGDTRIVPLEGPALDEIPHERLLETVRSAAGDTLRETRLLEQYDFYYLDRRRTRPLPVLLASLSDPDRTRYYIDPKTGRVAGTYNVRNWVNRWAYHALHSLDFPWLYNYRPAWDIVVITFMLGGTALCVTSLVLAWRVVGKKLSRIPMKASAATVLLVLTVSTVAYAQAPAPEPPPGWQPTPDAVRIHPAPYRQHSITLTLAPKEGMEFKYRLERGGAMLYSWTSTEPLFFEMHSSPDEAPRFAEFFEKSEAGARAHGSYVAPFTGVHGWFWENRTDREVRITLTATGFFNQTLEYRQGRPVDITPVP